MAGSVDLLTCRLVDSLNWRMFLCRPSQPRSTTIAIIHRSFYFHFFLSAGYRLLWRLSPNEVVVRMLMLTMMMMMEEEGGVGGRSYGTYTNTNDAHFTFK